MAQGGIRIYFKGGEPSRSKLIAIAKAANVSLTWLATGEGKMDLAATNTEHAQRVDIDLDTMEEVTAKVLEMLDERRPDLPKDVCAKICRLVYELYKRQGPMDDTSFDNIIELATFR